LHKLFKRDWEHGLRLLYYLRGNFKYASKRYC